MTYMLLLNSVQSNAIRFTYLVRVTKNEHYLFVFQFHNFALPGTP